MKRILCIILCLVVLFAFAGCNRTPALSSGYYYAVGDYQGGGTPYVSLDTDKREFVISEGHLISYSEYGTYKIRGGKLIATTQNTEFMFEINDANSLVLAEIKDDGFFDNLIGMQFLFSEDMK